MKKDRQSPVTRRVKTGGHGSEISVRSNHLAKVDDALVKITMVPDNLTAL